MIKNQSLILKFLYTILIVLFFGVILLGFHSYHNTKDFHKFCTEYCWVVLFCNLLYAIIYFILFAYLFIKEKGIVNKSSKDQINRFNFSALWGSYIWGITNNCYNTLLAIPLLLTPFSPIYSLICGIKGNEWSLKNRDWKTLEHFLDAQNSQAIVFGSLNLAFIIVLLLVCIIKL